MLLALPILSACSNNEGEEPTAKSANLEVNLNGCLSRSIITGTSMPEGSELGIFVADNANAVNYTNVKGVVNGTLCLLESSVPLDEEPNYVYAYYPYSSSNTDATAIRYDVTSQTEDFLMGYSADDNGIRDYVDSSRPTANMLLKHAFAKVTLNIKKSADNNNDGILSSVTLDSVATSGTVNLLQQTSVGDTPSGKVSTTTSVTLSATEESSVSLLVAPTSSLTSTSLTMVIDGDSYSTAIPTTKTTTWEAGKQYSYSVVVGENANVKINDASITLWNNNEQDEIIITKALEISTSIENSTRSVVTGSSFSEGDELGLFAYDATGELYDTLTVSSNVKATLTNSVWKCSPKIQLTGEREAYVYGYYPYTNNAVTMDNSVKIDMNPDWKIGQRDYMYCGRVVADATNFKPNLAFKHALARITLAISKGSNDNGDGVITTVGIANGESGGAKGTEFAETGWLNLTNGETTRIEDSDDNLVLNVNKTVSSANGVDLDILVIPNQSRTQAARTAAPVVVTLTIDGTPHTFTINNPQWYAGEQYTYPVVLNRQ